VGTWVDAATALITAAEGTEVPALEGSGTTTIGAIVSRSFLAPGPDFATDCSLLAVHVERISGLPVGSDSALGPDSCVLVPALRLVLTYAQDCAPAPTQKGKPPTPAEVEAWTVAWYEQTNALWQAVADAVLGGPVGQECLDATIGDGVTSGPEGLVVWFRIPVTVRLQA